MAGAQAQQQRSFLFSVERHVLACVVCVQVPCGYLSVYAPRQVNWCWRGVEDGQVELTIPISMIWRATNPRGGRGQQLRRRGAVPTTCLQATGAGAWLVCAVCGLC